MAEEYEINPTAGALNDAAFPDEAFECPYCGQMLAASCRVCVSCKLPIDPSRIRRAPEIPEPAPAPVEIIPPVRFSWSMFFTVLAISWVTSTVVLHFAGLVAGQIVMSGLQLMSAVWVFFDARQKMIRKPLRWALGALILWIVIFPWYLVRRQKLDAPCPFVEAESGPFARVMILVIFIFFLIAVIVTLVSGPEGKKPGPFDTQPSPTIRKTFLRAPDAVPLRAPLKNMLS